MTPENMPAPPAGPTTPSLRPPDFLLPTPDQATSRRRHGEPEIYVSWGGKVYGPSGVDEVISGVRTSYFEEDALFWFEGRSEWRPVEELPDLVASEMPALPVAGVPHIQPAEPIRPHWPGDASSTNRNSRGKRRRHNRKGRASRASRSGRAGRLIVLGAVLLAVVLTAGLLLLLSLT